MSVLIFKIRPSESFLLSPVLFEVVIQIRFKIVDGSSKEVINYVQGLHFIVFAIDDV